MGGLNGAVFRRKWLDPRRLRGLAAFAGSAVAYNNLVYLNLYFGTTLPLLGIAATAMYGMFAFHEKASVSLIQVVEEGEHAGKLRVTIQDSPIVSHNILVNVRDVQSIMSVGEEDLGADDVEGNIIWCKSYVTEADGVEHKNGTFAVPADAFRDKPFLEWIFAAKGEDEQTCEDFHDLMHNNFQEIQAMGGIRKLSSGPVFSQATISNEELERRLGNDASVEATIKELQELHGQEYLEKLTPSQFYKLYRDHTSLPESV